MRSIKEAEIAGKKVIVRVDFNVAIEAGEVVEEFRIEQSLPTIEYLQKKSAKEIILISHLGRPEGKVDEELRLGPVAKSLAGLLKINHIDMEKAKDIGLSNLDLEIYHLEPNIILLENIRFFPEEESGDKNFAKKLASLGDIFVNDAFSASHRDHASVSGIAKFLPSYAGFLLEKEISELSKLLERPAKPFLLILGGAKPLDKIPVIKNLIGRCEWFEIGGAVANSFLRVRGIDDLGASLVHEDSLAEAHQVWQMIMDESNKDMFLPRDFVISKSFKKPVGVKTIGMDKILVLKNSKYSIVDIGPKTLKIFGEKIKEAKTIFWNGNMGVSEVSEFSKGTLGLTKLIAASDAYKVIGGGDTVGFVSSAGLTDKFNFVSTGGGATLEFLAGKRLPGIEALNGQK
jgi:phosphoglycerate kinase